MYSVHGARFDVRREYDKLPCQAFWTFVTGKGRVLSPEDKVRAMRPMSTAWTVMHITGSWLMIAAALWLGNKALDSTAPLALVAGVGLSWLIVVNRARSLQATFHYVTHGSAMPHRRLARWTATAAFTAPFLYQSWSAYCDSHVKTHHHLRALCSVDDPDQQFIAQNGFRPRMSVRAFWWRLWTRPFSPAFLWGQLKSSWFDSFIEPSCYEVFFRMALVLGTASAALAYGWFDRLLLLFWVPAWLLFRHSMWLQLITEHLWFAPRGSDAGSPEAYGRLTWGRFQGRPLPSAGVLAWVRWCALLLLYDLPVRLYVYPQDLPNHDFHHRLPLAPYHNIADLRRTCEGESSRFGPSYEVWGFLETLCVLRDHLCYGESNPFRWPARSSL